MYQVIQYILAVHSASSQYTMDNFIQYIQYILAHSHYAMYKVIHYILAIAHFMLNMYKVIHCILAIAHIMLCTRLFTTVYSS